MVRSLTQWTKTLSFPARISPNKTSKDSINIHQISPTITPTISNNSLSKSNDKNNDINNMMNSNHNSLNEVNKVSVLVFVSRKSGDKTFTYTLHTHPPFFIGCTI